MSIRLQAILIISLSTLLIILFSVFSGTKFVSQNITIAQETDMQIVADIADLYISNEIELLFFKATDTAKDLIITKDSDWQNVLSKHINLYPEFIGAAIFDASLGRVIASGEKPAPVNAMETTHIAEALKGKKTLNTTYFYNPNTNYDSSDNSLNPNANPDDVVFYLAVPLPATQDKLLAITIPGMFFHEKLREFQIWETGHVFMVDTKGSIVSNPRAHWVYQRCNLLEFAKVDSGFTALAETVIIMASGKNGIGYYTVYNVPRVCAYKQVSGSQDGWSLGAVAPLPESPFRSINTALLVVGIIGFFLSILAAVIASHFIKRPFEKVEALKEESELNSQYKSQFLANMSHEMRTPLTSVIGLTELTLRTANLDDETHSNLVKVYRSGDTLLSLINDILDISKIEAGKLELNPSEYDFPSLINDTITQSILYVGDKPVEFILDINENLPRRLYGDELRVKQIFNNLLSNAFKFTNEGKVILSIQCENDGDSVWLTAQVSDTGTGIKDSDFDKLFTLYAKMEKEVKQDSTRRREGTGLGLSICKKMAEMMNGFITVESEYGMGSTFSFKIRQKFVNDSTIGQDVVESLKKFHYSIDKFKNEDKTRINLSYARVLVVDDNTANLDVAKGLMSLYGMKIDCVTGGRSAIEAIRSEKIKYNAIFMDHMMPDIDGIEATIQIRELETEYAKNIPIIALTANAVIGNEEMFLEKGFQAFLPKPIDLTRLDNILRQWVRDKEEEAKLQNKWITIDDNPKNKKQIFSENIPGLDIEKCKSHFMKEDIFINVLGSFARNTKPLLEEIKNTDGNNLSIYAVVVHGIKGSVRGIFAQTAGDQAEALEMAAKKDDKDFVINNNQKFIQTVSSLISGIEEVLKKYDTNKKQVLAEPDSVLLKKLLAACESMDIDDMDSAMNEIENYEYSNDDGLVVWLREKLDQGKYKEIKEKLKDGNHAS